MKEGKLLFICILGTCPPGIRCGQVSKNSERERILIFLCPPEKDAGITGMPHCCYNGPAGAAALS